MPKISDDVVRAVTDAAKIEDVVGDFVTLRRAGVNLTGLCPFHDDENDGNFIVRPSTLSIGATGRNTYKCFVCGAKGGPVNFLMEAEKMSFPDAIRYIGKKYSIDVDNVPLNWTPPPPKPVPPPKPPLEMRREWVKQLMECDYNRNIFTYWYGKLPWNQEQRKRMAQTLWMYCVGCWHDGRVVFWQIDHNGIPRAAKLMKYETDGHRYHEKKGEKNSTGWLYNQDGYRDICQPNEHTILKPLFGAHLLKRYPQATVNVVESEKTAIIMANYYGCPESQLWLACGGLKFLNLDAMQVLIDQGRKVWLWPDKDGIEKWQEVADKLGSEQVQVYTKFFDACWIPEDGDKADAADIAIRMMRNPDFKPREISCDKDDRSCDKDDRSCDKNDRSCDGTDKQTIVWNSDEPFLDTLEMQDPLVHEWRQRLRLRYNFRNNTTHLDNTLTVGEILSEHPILKPLIEDERESE